MEEVGDPLAAVLPVVESKKSLAVVETSAVGVAVTTAVADTGVALAVEVTGLKEGVGVGITWLVAVAVKVVVAVVVALTVGVAVAVMVAVAKHPCEETTPEQLSKERTSVTFRVVLNSATSSMNPSHTREVSNAISKAPTVKPTLFNPG